LAGADGRAGTCEDCSAPLARGQRYCLACGERSGPRSSQLLALLDRVRDASTAGSGEREEPIPPRLAAAPGNSHRRRIPRLTPALAPLGELTPPSRRVSALLVLVFLGFGVLLGNVASSRVEDSLAASARPRIKLLLPAANTTAATTPEASPTSEPPEATAEPTPEVASVPETASSPSPTQPAAAKTEAQGKEGGGKASAPAANSPATKLPAIKHVFVIMLSNEPYASVFGPASTAPYLSHTLEHRGELLVRYYAVAHQQLANEIALLSGQGPTPATAANCPVYSDLVPAGLAGEGQLSGEGCVYPASTETLPGQLSAKHLTARAYVQGIDEAGSAAPACAHPALGQPDPSGEATATQAYATFRNPFVYFHALSDSPSCALDDVGLASLDGDLSSTKRTPSFSYIVPDRCHDASPGPCPGGGSGGVTAANTLLAQIVPKILASQAYKHGGLLVITTDEAPSSGEYADSSSCCGQPRFANLPPPSGPAAALPPEGGGQVGALLLSPYVKAGAINQESFNHFSLLRTLEDFFGVKHLGYAAGAHVGSLEPSLFLARPSAK
jgi:phosphatidylinositol-3-phosphatase